MDENLTFKNIALKNVMMDVKPVLNSQRAFDGINIKFNEISQDQIYKMSNGSIVTVFPEWLRTEGFTLDLKATAYLFSAIENTISTYLYSLRKGSPLHFDLEFADKSGYLKIEVTKHFFRVKNSNLGRYKITMSIYKRDPDFGEYEEIMLEFTKRDLMAMLKIFQRVAGEAWRTKPISVIGDKVSMRDPENAFAEREILEREVPIYMSKLTNSIVIGDVWLHGQEIFNLFYLMSELTYGFHIEKKLSDLNMFFRQMVVKAEDGVLYLYLDKMNKNNELIGLVNKNGARYGYRIPIASIFMAYVNLFVSIEMVKHPEMMADVLDTTNPFAATEHVKYHINTKDGSIGFGYTKEKLIVFVKAGESYKEHENIPVLKEAGIAIKKSNMIKLLKALAIGYNLTYMEGDRNFNMVKFYEEKSSVEEGRIRYEFEILSNMENVIEGVYGVLKINKYMVFGKKDLHLIASFRQPLYRKYLFQMIAMIMATAKDFEEFSFIKEVEIRELVHFKYSSTKKLKQIPADSTKKVFYGIKKTEGQIFWGTFLKEMLEKDAHIFESGDLVKLTRQDIEMLNISSYDKIITGKWLPFVGDKISVGPDGFITDMSSEIDVEKDQVEANEWASAIYLCSSVDYSGGEL